MDVILAENNNNSYNGMRKSTHLNKCKSLQLAERNAYSIVSFYDIVGKSTSCDYYECFSKGLLCF